RLSVTDEGAGLDGEQLAKLFVPFERLSAAQSGIEGTGLGLVLARRLSEVMGGSLEVESTPGSGTTFSVLLRTVAPATLGTDEAKSDASLTETRSYAAHRRVLYVEDMAANIRLVEQILKRRPSVELVPVMQGATALELARNCQPDLVLLDLHLPDIGGEEVLRRLQADAATSHIPVVVLSADATARQRERLSEAGAKAYLTKPIAIRRFLEVVDQTLEG
ncbi:MAG: response regulator, partial [Acidimicrobiia bacterium]|nr:response regulator [Acidimicrobiia bacterium]